MSTEAATSPNITPANLAVVSGLAIFILAGGLFVLWRILEAAPEERSNLWGERLGQHTLQILGLTFILPTIVIIAAATGLNPEAVTALLGSIIGYIFGSSRSSDATPSQLLSAAQMLPNTGHAAPPTPRPPSPSPSPSPTSSDPQASSAEPQSTLASETSPRPTQTPPSSTLPTAI